MKYTLLALAVLGLMIRGYFMYQAHQIQSAKDALQSHGTIDSMRRKMQGADIEADTAARGKTTGNLPPKPSSKSAAAGSPAPDAPAQQQQEIDAALKAVHLTTIMPGQPGLVIIDKQEYSEGEELPLPKGRKAKIITVQDDGVQLTCNGMTFHLDAPGGPDLAALRKKK